jgi:hypothetical protein
MNSDLWAMNSNFIFFTLIPAWAERAQADANHHSFSISAYPDTRKDALFWADMAV